MFYAEKFGENIAIDGSKYVGRKNIHNNSLREIRVKTPKNIYLRFALARVLH
jgi:hypothetical protein